MKSIPDQLQQSRDSLLESIRNGEHSPLADICTLSLTVGQSRTEASHCVGKNSADTTTTQTDILTSRTLKERRHQPVKLIDVLNVAEEGADLLGFER